MAAETHREWWQRKDRTLYAVLANIRLYEELVRNGIRDRRFAIENLSDLIGNALGARPIRKRRDYAAL